MKKLYTLLLAFSATGLSYQASAQLNHCGTMNNLSEHVLKSPAVAARMDAAEVEAAMWLKEHPSDAKKTRSVITIPVVVHVVYKDSTMNISTAQVMSQIDVLNADYRRMNADTGRTRSVFLPVAADAEIEFCLAQRDPSGNPTSGITRTYSSGGTFLGYFGPTDDVKSTLTGGVNPWPTDQYLNIWVCDLIPFILGYAQFPGDNPATDGVVIGYNFFGTIGTVSAPYDLGRTASHEVGHWLGLRHIWGDAACAEDSIADTPHAADATSGCDTTANTCVDTPIDWPDMIENYMDYSDDDCMNMFTLGQKDRMWSFLNTARLSLQTSMGCVPVVGVNDPVKNLVDMVLAPNPSGGVFTLQLNGTNNLPFTCRITDIRGQVIWQQSGMESGNPYMLDLSAQADGMYFIEARSGESRMLKKLLIAH